MHVLLTTSTFLSWLQTQKPSLKRNRHCSGAIRDPKLPKEVNKVGLDGSFAQMQDLCDLLVACTTCYLGQYFKLTDAERLCGWHLSLPEEPHRDRRSQHRFPLSYRANGCEQLVPRCVLQQIAYGTCFNRTQDICIALIRGIN